MDSLDDRLRSLGNRLKSEGLEYIIIVKQGDRPVMIFDEQADKRDLAQLALDASMAIKNKK